MARFFTLREAHELLPHIQAWLAEAASAQEALTDIEGELHALAAHITMSGGVEIDPVAVVKMKVARQRAIDRGQAAIESIEDTGCLLKDLEKGLIDFPAILDGAEVYLCWRRGEERIEFWHRVEDGFAGRRRIGDEFAEGSSGSKPS